MSHIGTIFVDAPNCGTFDTELALTIKLGILAFLYDIFHLPFEYRFLDPNELADNMS